MHRLCLRALLLILACLLCATGCEDKKSSSSDDSSEDSKKKKKKKKGKATTVPMKDFIAAYKKDGAAAKKKYGDKLIKFTGAIVLAKEGASDGDWMVFLDASGDDTAPTQVVCHPLKEKAYKGFPKKGTRTTFTGEVDPEHGGPEQNIEVHDCEAEK